MTGDKSQLLTRMPILAQG